MAIQVIRKVCYLEQLEICNDDRVLGEHIASGAGPVKCSGFHRERKLKAGLVVQGQGPKRE